jgi:SAM-dependent methyltransferase
VTRAEPCPACGNPESRLLYTAGDRLYQTTSAKFQIVACQQCGLSRLSPAPPPGELERYYPDEYWHAAGETLAGWLEERYRRLVLLDHVRFVERAIRDSEESGLLLDVGCGGGLLLRLLKERGMPVLGLDFSLAAATVAWRVNGVPTICGALSQVPLPPGSCAAVSMFHVLEHLYDPAVYLRVAFDLLRPQGRLIVQVPNADCWQFLLFGESWNGLDVPRHLFHFRASDLETLLEACGFTVLRRKFFSLRDNPAGFATSLAPGLDPMARRVRRIPESTPGRLAKNVLYLSLVLAALPFTLMEAACRAGSTIMIEARKKG